jgi:hypothetical protein
MRCEKCGTENLEGSKYCKECRAPLSTGVPPTEPLAHDTEGGATFAARFLNTAWSRKGPILMAFFVALMMAVVFAPWAFIKVEVFGFSLVSRNYNGWEIIIPRILFYLSIIPLLASLLLVAGVGTRRRVVETHIITFFAGVMFTVWLIIFVLSEVIKSVVKNVKVLYVNVAGGQITTIFLIVGLILGIIITTYDWGRQLSGSSEGG